MTVVEHSKGCKIATRKSETNERKCDRPKKGAKGIREVSQLTERCDGYEGGVRRCEKV